MGNERLVALEAVAAAATQLPKYCGSENGPALLEPPLEVWFALCDALDALEATA